MVEARLESLVQRLEVAVARAEGLSGGQSSGGGQAPSGGSGGCALAKSYVTAVTPLMDAVKAKTAELGNQYVTGKHFFVDIFIWTF